MADFSIVLEGSGEIDEGAIREAFAIAVRAVKAALKEAGFEGELVVDGVTYPADDVDSDTEEEQDGDGQPAGEAEDESEDEDNDPA